MGWRWIIAETITGRPVAEVTNLVGGDSPWTRQLRGVGSGSTVFSLADSPFSRSQHRDLFYPWIHTLHQCWDTPTGPWPVYSGLLNRAGWKAKTKLLTVSHAEVRVLLSRRLPFPVGGWGTGTVDAYSLDARRAMALFVRKGLIDGLPRWKIPLDVISHVGGSRRDTVHNDQFATIEDVVSRLETAENGPDLDFNPRRVPVSDYFDWEARIGNPSNGGLLDGPAFEWDLTSDSGAQDIDADTNGMNMTSGIFTPGEGTGSTRPFGQAALDTGFETRPYPYLDRVEVVSQEANVSKLDAIARSIRLEHQEPTDTVGFSVQASSYPTAAAFVPGMRVRAKVAEDEWMPAGWTPFSYVLAFSGNRDETITFKVKEDA
ncbi:hypothetical protein [Pseudoclavibacter sp. 8L]|uniref:hypothetical protein n=1 Tax=Pseudoclavibacter sp. 8L TaxID=2653162 RepID=UPI0012F235D8|nr:hypothetical protein [Pseudoclavibacter sp. 8L]VXB74804.1 hypothetical protein PSCLAVI8L_180141 [Pseudoclavibacter sp. 8L]